MLGILIRACTLGASECANEGRLGNRLEFVASPCSGYHCLRQSLVEGWRPCLRPCGELVALAEAADLLMALVSRTVAFEGRSHFRRSGDKPRHLENWFTFGTDEIVGAHRRSERSHSRMIEDSLPEIVMHDVRCARVLYEELEAFVELLEASFAAPSRQSLCIFLGLGVAFGISPRVEVCPATMVFARETACQEEWHVISYLLLQVRLVLVEM